MWRWKLALFVALFGAVVGLCARPALAHELWIETDLGTKIGQQQQIQVCFGHSGEKTPRELLEKYKSKLNGSAVRPDGTPHALGLTVGEDSYTANLTPGSPGCHTIGAELQVGIIDEEFHGIPANTRIVMYGKSLARVGASSEGLGNTLGSDLEIVPVTDPGSLHPGELVTVKVLLRGKPIGGRDVVVSLGTAGPEEPPDDPRLQSTQWAIEAHPDPRTGQVCFPLIVAGRHVFSMKYFDETPGTYQGELEHASEFSHLRKGDTFERTMYVSTSSIDVAAK